MFNFIPILAAGGGAISLLFLVIAIVSWLWNVFNGNQKVPGAGRQQQPQAGGKRPETELQAEINRFLKNVMGQKQNQEEELEVLAIEDVEEEKPRPQKPRSKAGASKRKSGAAQPQPEREEGPGEVRPGGRISQRKGPGSANLGSGVRQHVAEHMQEGRVRQQAEAHLGHGVAEKVQQDMGTFSGGEPASGKSGDCQVTTATSVARMMRDPAGIKQAFVLNLILNRPSFGKRK